MLFIDAKRILRYFITTLVMLQNAFRMLQGCFDVSRILQFKATKKYFVHPTFIKYKINTSKLLIPNLEETMKFN